MDNYCPNCGFNRLERSLICHACGMVQIPEEFKLEGDIVIQWLPGDAPPELTRSTTIGTEVEDPPMCPNCLGELREGLGGGLWVCLGCQVQYTEDELAALSDTLRIRFAVASREIRRHARPLAQPILDLVEQLVRRVGRMIR